ncbi:hypothetical protein C2L64_44815 [Paraburkholderia hospita]|uniref:Lipoprotein n=1 Tax=Paraburkholderia hospita TaxID=169430 RepID=A0AAN1JKM8_9BURK|nr:hypothetical protein [Paraburkholderia hospita]AUT75510.1 hypothetical protein C2L64_44815 [Paraburkholderia hospita]
MNNLLMLLIAAGSSSLCACSSQPQRVETARPVPTIVVQQPKGEPGDFVLCKDGRVLVFPAAHPKTCT